MDFALKGVENRKKRAAKVWMKFKVLYDAGVPVEEILERIKKKGGKRYSRGYFYTALKKLEKYMSGKEVDQL